MLFSFVAVVVFAVFIAFAMVIGAASKPNLVDIRTIDPTIKVDIPYATENNFTGIKLYTHNICLLRPKVAEALAGAHAEFVTMGYRLKMLDCYRPKSVSLAMWKAGENHNIACRRLGRDCKYSGCDPNQPDCLWEPLTNYVSRNSKHNRAATVDLTIVRMLGGPVDMGTAFDHFGPEARTKNASGKALENRMLLKTVMTRHGFRNYFREWWHYNHVSYANYGVLNVPLADYVETPHE